MDKNSPGFSLLGSAQLAGAQVIIGLNLVLAKSLLPHLAVFFILFARFGFGFLIGLILNFKNNHTLLKKSDGESLTKVDHVFLIAQALTAGLLFNSLMLIGMQYTSAGTAGLITSVLPAVIAGLSIIFLKEHMTTNRLISILLAIVGIALLNLHGFSLKLGGKNLLGQGIVLLSVFPEAIFTIIAKLHRTGISTLNKVIYMNFYNFIFFMPICLWYSLEHSTPHLLATDWLRLFLYGLNSVLFFLLWYKGLAKTSAIISGLYTAIAPCATILLAYIFLGEAIHTIYIITFIIIFISIVIGSGLIKRKPFISIF